MAAKPSHKAIRPLQRCQACGSSWFREIEVQQYSEIYADYRLSAPAWILVCLCGTPVRPNLGGVRAGRTPNLQTVALMDSMACAGEQVRKEQDAEAVLQPCREHAVTRAELNTPRNGCAA